ncbi:hypothetical protein Naga_100486g5 [Nannochloropsis gaditana]|uniref:Uncharacterized protein n=1 Tax=Nannochloropsis gaditana TaxID=72520 RepID=W7TLU4_9STRA|nr:hypothetical protein Naga_100486g5 [Nannochloropsis gaditana]
MKCMHATRSRGSWTTDYWCTGKFACSLWWDVALPASIGQLSVCTGSPLLENKSPALYLFNDERVFSHCLVRFACGAHLFFSQILSLFSGVIDVAHTAFSEDTNLSH